ncbi:MAG: M67 family metallopeptidase [Anaerolineae bacterium]
MSNHGGQLIVPAAMQAEIIAHARAGWPEEVCGILRGRDGIVTGLLPATNVAADRRFNYTVDPTILLRQFDFEEAGEEMIAIYHSHPSSPAYPSATDARQATYPDAVYLICSLQQAQAPVLRGFRLHTLPYDSAASDFPLHPVRGSDDFWACQHPEPDAFYLLRLNLPETGFRWLQVRIAEVTLRSS